MYFNELSLVLKKCTFKNIKTLQSQELSQPKRTAHICTRHGLSLAVEEASLKDRSDTRCVEMKTSVFMYKCKTLSYMYDIVYLYIFEKRIFNLIFNFS